MIIADENVEQYWIELIRNKGIEVLSIREKFAGIADAAVIDLVKQHQAILITEDKDFGELVFAHHLTNVSIIFLRYDQPQYAQIENQLIETLEKLIVDPPHFFITISKLKTRVKRL